MSSISIDYDGHSGKSYYPRVEYYKGNDTLSYSNKGWSSRFLDVGDNVTVIVDNEDESVVELKTVFNYWIPVHTIIIFIFLLIVGVSIETTDFSK